MIKPNKMSLVPSLAYTGTINTLLSIVFQNEKEKEYRYQEAAERERIRERESGGDGGNEAERLAD